MKSRTLLIVGGATAALWALSRRASAADRLPDEGLPDEGFPDEGLPDEGLPDEGLPDEGFSDDLEPGVLPGPVIPTVPDADVPSIVSGLDSPAPRVGHYYQVAHGDTLLGTAPRSIVYQALLAFGGEAIAKVPAKRLAYLDLILCSGWNDYLYGTFGYGSGAHPGPHGRSIRMLRYHSDNRARLLAGAAPWRNIGIGAPGDGGKGTGRPLESGRAEAFEYLWLPEISTQAIQANGSITTEGVRWADGSSKINPPPEVVDIGIETSRDPGLSTYGCREGQIALGPV